MGKDELEDMVKSTCKIAWGATDILRSYYRNSIDIVHKQDGPVTSADIVANQYILTELQQTFPGENFGYLSEETYKTTNLSPLPQDWVWIIDPLDGTRDFIEKTGEYAVQIALANHGRPQLAVVALPEKEKVYFATKGQGTRVQGRDDTIASPQVSTKSDLEALTLVVSRSHRDRRLETLLNRLPLSNRRPVGSVGCKIAAIIEQEADVYISLSGKTAPKDWDFAAPELILTEAGGRFTNFRGEDLTYNTGDVCQWGGLMASNGPCHEQLYSQAMAILEDLDRLDPP